MSSMVAQRLSWLVVPLLAMAWWSAPDWPARSENVAEPWRNIVVHAATQWAQWGRQVPVALSASLAVVQEPLAGVPEAPALPGPEGEQVAMPLAPVVPLAGGMILVVGDSLANGVAQGLQATVPKGWTVVDWARHSTGLSNQAYFDWAGHLTQAIGELSPDVVLVHLGGNDGQAIRDGATWARVGTAEWTALYQARAEALVAAARTGNPDRHVIWLGLPPMRDQDFVTKETALTVPQQQGAQAAGALWVDAHVLWPDGYVYDGVDAAGRHQVWRASDGVHYARAGSRLLAQAAWHAAIDAGWVSAVSAGFAPSPGAE